MVHTQGHQGMGPAMYDTCSLMACPPWRVTFDPSHAHPSAWQEVKGEAVSVE